MVRITEDGPQNANQRSVTKQFAHSPAKVGKDAAELCGLDEPTGVIATNDADALLAMDTDCVCYMAQGETRIRETIQDLTRILEAGKNVVNTSIVSLCYPPYSKKHSVMFNLLMKIAR